MRWQTSSVLTVTILFVITLLGPLGGGQSTIGPEDAMLTGPGYANDGTGGPFLENMGQWDNGLTHIAKTGFGHVGLGQDGIYYHLYDRTTLGEHKPTSNGILDTMMKGKSQEEMGASLIKICFAGANDVRPVGYSMVADKTNFFLGNDPARWVTGVRSFETIEYKGLWDGIDLVLTLKDGGLKYDLVLEPGADPEKITFRVEGHTGLSAQGTGLVINTPIGPEITDSGLCANYDDGSKESICASFILKGSDSYGFDLMHYNRSRPVIIDPLVFSTYYGGTSGDSAQDIDMDGNGNLYVVGYTDSYDFPITKSAYQTSNNGFIDIFVFMMSGDGKTIFYSTFIGGTDYDSGMAIEVDGSGYAYVTGGSCSLDFPTTSGAFNETHWNNIDYLDVIVFKLDPRGSSLVFSTYVAGEYDDAGCDIAIDDVGSTFVVGFSGSENFPTTTGAYDEVHNGYDDIILFMLSYTGAYLKYSTYIGGSDDDTGMGILYRGSDAVFLTGSTNSYDFPVTANVRHNGGFDVVAAKMDLGNSTLSYSTLIGGDDNEEGIGISVDDQACAYITGYTFGGSRTRFPTTTGAYDTSFNGIIDIFVSKLDRKGSSLLYSTYVGGSGIEYGTDIRLDADLNAYVCGLTMSNDFPTTPGADYMTFQGGNQDAVVLKLDNIGSTLVYSTYLGGSYDESAYGILLEGNVKVIVTGDTGSKNFPTTSGVVQTSLAGDFDCFVTKLNFVSRPTEPRSPFAYGGAGHILLNWTAPFSDGGAPVLYYTVYKGLSDSSLNFYKTTTNIILNDTGVNAGTTYYYAISANNSVGEGPKSLSVSSMSKGVPGTPRSFMIIGGDHFIDLNWQPPLLNGGSPVTGYWIYRGTSEESIERYFLELPGANYHRDTDVLPGTTYYYSMTASNLIGESSPTQVLNATLPKAPSPPLNLTAVAGDGYVELDWEDPLDLGGIFLSGFRVYRGTPGSQGGLIATATSSQSDYNDTTVANGITYFYNVTAFNTIGESTSSDTTVTPLGLPDSPVVKPPVSGDGFVHLFWEPPMDNGGSPILHYRVYSVNDQDTLELTAELGPDARDFNHTDLTNGRIYEHCLSAVNKRGESQKSSIITAKPVGLPDPPHDLVAIPGNGFVQLDWLAPLSDGGSDIIKYTVHRGTSQATIEEFIKVGETRSLNYNDTAVTNGVPYRYAVMSLSLIGPSEPSNEVTATPLGPPSVPLNLTLFAKSRAVNVSWSEPDDDGGAPILGYRLFRGEYIAELNELQTIDGNLLSFTDSDVENGVVYYYQLQAFNSKGRSPLTQIKSIRPLGVPSAPKNVKAVEYQGGIKVSWALPDDTGGTELTGFDIYRSDDGGDARLIASVGPGVTTYLDKDVKGGVSYVYTVKAKNSAGSSTSSTPAALELEVADGGGSGGLIIGLSLGAVIAIVIIGLILFLILRKGKGAAKHATGPEERGPMVQTFPQGIQPEQFPIPPTPPQQQLQTIPQQQQLQGGYPSEQMWMPPAQIPELGPAPPSDQPQIATSDPSSEPLSPQEAQPYQEGGPDVLSITSEVPADAQTQQ